MTSLQHGEHCRALCQFLWQTGLDRSACILHDLDAIAKASPGEVPLQLSPTQQVRQMRIMLTLVGFGANEVLNIHANYN